MIPWQNTLVVTLDLHQVQGHTARLQYWWIPKRPIKLPYVKDGKLLEPLHQCLLQPKEKHIMEGESVEFFLVCSRLGKGSSTDSPENQDSSPYAPIVIKRLEFYRYFSPNKYPLPLPEVIPGTQENNYIHTFRYRPRQEDWGRLKLVAHFSIPEGNEKPSYSLLASVFSSPEAPARFTGFQGEAIVNGSLVIRVGLNVKIPARYTIEANLYAGKSPVAYAKKDSQLKQGAQQIKLLFFGKIFHEAGHPGPYRIVGLRGTQHNSALNTEVLRRPPKEVQKYLQNLKSVEPNKRIIPSYEKEYLTDSYELDEFSPKEWDSPRKRRRLNDLNKIRD